MKTNGRAPGREREGAVMPEDEEFGIPARDWLTLHEASEILGLTVRQARAAVEADLLDAISVSTAAGSLTLVSLAGAGGSR